MVAVVSIVHANGFMSKFFMCYNFAYHEGCLEFAENYYIANLNV